MRLLDRLGVGAGREAEDRIGLLDGHVAARGSGAAGSGAAGTFARTLVTPVRADAVEIGLEQARTLLVFRPALAQQRQKIGRSQLVTPHAGKPAAQDRALHTAGLVFARPTQ